MKVQELESNLQRQIGRIEEAIVKIRQNVLIDISPIDKDVAELCRKILGADEEAMKVLEPKMFEMINKLDEFAVELQDYQTRVNAEGNS